MSACPPGNRQGIPSSNRVAYDMIFLFCFSLRCIDGMTQNQNREVIGVRDSDIIDDCTSTYQENDDK